MKAKSILDADMATLLEWARRGLNWWLAELADMVPDRVRRSLVRRQPRLLWDGGETLTVAETGHAAPGNFGRADIVLPSSLCLVRQLSLPAMARSDLDAMIALEAERLMPLPADRLLIAAAPTKRGEIEQRVTVAGISRDRVAALLAQLGEGGVVPVALRVDTPAATLDFLPAARTAGLISREPASRMVWWSVAALLMALNLATLVWRDVDHVERLQTIVDDRRPLALGARRAAERLEVRTRLVREAIARRRDSDPLVPLAIVSGVLPADAWIQRFAWDGRTLRISGYRRGSGDMVKALRDSGLFEDVRNTSSEVQAAIPVGQPFDITARARRAS
ncbi:MAG: hypothetical protein ACKOVA_08755 [Novosphingobium sp.]